jgi:hypothetical protein
MDPLVRNDLERWSPLGQFTYTRVDVPAADVPITVAHDLTGKTEDLVYWVVGVETLSPVPLGTVPVLYEYPGERGPNYLKLRSTVGGVRLTLLMGVAR